MLAPFAAVPVAVLDHIGQISPLGVAVYVALARFADNQTRECFPKQNTLARLLNLPRQTVNSLCLRLEVSGLIEIIRRPGYGHIYKLLDIAAHTVPPPAQDSTKANEINRINNPAPVGIIAAPQDAVELVEVEAPAGADLGEHLEAVEASAAVEASPPIEAPAGADLASASGKGCQEPLTGGVSQADNKNYTHSTKTNQQQQHSAPNVEGVVVIPESLKRLPLASILTPVPQEHRQTVIDAYQARHEWGRINGSPVALPIAMLRALVNQFCAGTLDTLPAERIAAKRAKTAIAPRTEKPAPVDKEKGKKALQSVRERLGGIFLR